MAALTNNYRANEKAAHLIAYNAGANVTIWQGRARRERRRDGTDRTGDRRGGAKRSSAWRLSRRITSGGAAGANSGRVQKSGSFVYTLNGGCGDAGGDRQKSLRPRRQQQ